jgi:hypothetical protein
MADKKEKFFKVLGVMGVLISLAVFIHRPSFPTPDKLFVFLLFVFMAFSQSLSMIKRLGPFVATILIYESFRSFADKLNSHVNYSLAPHFDKAVFGNLPTVYLQNWLWHGHVNWYDYVFYLAYMMHFIIPLALAILIWKTRPKHYWEMLTTYIFVAFGAFLTYFIIPAAPPWLASQNHYIQPITRISSNVWYSLGLKDFPSFYNHIAANPVAAIPSLHAAWATLLVLFVFKLYGRRFGLISLIYPFLIFVGTIYQGEHYFFDVILGIIYALAGYLLAPKLLARIKRLSK